MNLWISNKEARWLWLNGQGLGDAPTGTLDLLAIIKKLGFVQLDTIRNVTRAHHHILWSRNQNYREPMLNKLLADERGLFEHFTHDASVIPMDFYPMWTRQFRRLGERVEKTEFYRSAMNDGEFAAIKGRIEQEGPLSTHAFDTKIVGKKEMWARPPHKRALDQMWYRGELTTAHRTNFIKYYDLIERVIPVAQQTEVHDDAAQIDWLCREAINRLGFGAPGDIQRFWAAVSAAEVRQWVQQSELVTVDVEGADGKASEMLAPADIEQQLNAIEKPTSRLRILSPFDPAVRDRNRLSRLYGFDFRIEIFVPAAKREWGYYVYPLLEGDRFVGRIDLKADRKKGILSVINLWTEPGMRWTEARSKKLETELQRLAKMIGANTVDWKCPTAPTEKVST